MGPIFRGIDPAAFRTTLLVLAVLTVLGIGLVVIENVRRAIREPEESTAELRAAFQEAFEEGEIDEEEYRRTLASLEKSAPAGGEPRITRF